MNKVKITYSFKWTKFQCDKCWSSRRNNPLTVHIVNIVWRSIRNCASGHCVEVDPGVLMMLEYLWEYKISLAHCHYFSIQTILNFIKQSAKKEYHAHWFFLHKDTDTTRRVWTCKTCCASWEANQWCLKKQIGSKKKQKIYQQEQIIIFLPPLLNQLLTASVTSIPTFSLFPPSLTLLDPQNLFHFPKHSCLCLQPVASITPYFSITLFLSCKIVNVLTT